MQVIRGFFVLEGLDGAGTTTQGRMLAAALAARGEAVAFTGEPTDAPIGRLIRSALAGDTPLCRATMAYLFAADRHEHLYEHPRGIVSRCREGQIVVCDRYLFSSLAYQSVDCGEGLVERLNEGFPLPQALIYLDVPVETCMRRLENRPAREIFEHADFLHKVRANYMRAVERFRDRGLHIGVFDGTLSEQRVHESILAFLTGLNRGRATRN